MNKQSLGKSWAQWVLKHRALVIIGSFILVFALGSGLSKLTMSSDYQYFFKEDNSQRLAFDKLQKVYTRDDSAIIAIKSSQKDVFNKRTLELVHKLTQESWKVPFSYRVDSLTNFQNTRANENDLIVRDFVRDDDPLDQAQLKMIKETSLKEPLLAGQIVSRDGAVTSINIRVNVPGKSPFEVPQVANHIRGMVSKVKAEYPDHEIYLSGLVMMNNAFNEAGMKDMTTLMPLMYLIIAILVIFFLKSFFATLSTLFVLFFSVVAGMGVAGLLGIPLTPPSSIAPVVILTLAIADSVHILKSILAYLRQGMDKKQAIIEGVRVNFQPVFLTSLTTVIGFLSLNTAEIPPLGDLGNITAFGVTFAFLYSVTLLPALISFFPIKAEVGSQTKEKGYRRLVQCGEWVIQHRKAVLILTVFSTLFLFFQVPKIQLNDQFVNYFSKDIEFRKHTDWITKNMAGIYQIQFDLSSNESYGVSDPTFLKNIDRFAEMYRQVPEVTHVNSITDTFRRLNKNMHADDPNYYKLPMSKELAAQYLLLYEMSLPYGLDLNNQIDVDKSSTRMIVTVGNITTARVIEIGEMGKKWLQDNTPKFMHTEGTSPTLMFSYITENNVKAMFWGTLLALLLITATMIIALRSWKYGIISLLPNMIPAGMALGIWSLTVGQAGFAISVVASVTLGIVVDDTVHFLSKYVRAREEKGLDAASSIRESFQNVGPALIATSVILTSGFGVMMLSSFKMNWVLGTLSAITIVIALLIDFTFLPALLYSIDHKKAEEKPETHGEPLNA